MNTRLGWKLMAGLVAVAVIATSAYAQDQQKGKGRGRGGLGFFGGGGGGSLVMLANNEAVQKEIGANEATVGKIKTIGDDARKAMQEERSGAGGGNFANLSDEERQKLFEKMRETAKKVNDKFEPKLKEALSADQYKRLKEISIQAQGIGALSDETVAKELGITDEQKKKIADIRSDYQQKRSGLFGPNAGDDARAKARELGEEETKKVNEVLTSQQQEKFTALKGKPFDVAALRAGFGGGAGGKRPQRNKN